MSSALLWVLAVVALQRGIELWYAQRNTRRLREAGAIEVAPEQHPLFVALHLAWLLAMALLIPAATQPNWILLASFAALQALRIWVIATLGPFWTTRILTLPAAPLVVRGPYRFLRHPNYVIVILEIAVLPLAFGAIAIALVFSILNGLLLTWRIVAEDRALSERRVHTRAAE